MTEADNKEDQKSFPRDFPAAEFLRALLEETKEDVVVTDTDFVVLARSRFARPWEPSQESGPPKESAAADTTPRLLSRSGQSPAEERVRAVKSGDGTTLGYLISRNPRTTVRDSLDPLTGVADRCKLESEFMRRSSERSSAGESMSLLFIDLDDFKPVNDMFGHWVGDQILMQFACLLQNYFRESDLVARYGGDEFVVLCSDCSAAVAEKRIRAFREKLAGQYIIASFPGSGQKEERISLAFSFGVVEAAPDDTFEKTVRLADKALYRMKHARTAVLT